MPGLYRSCKAQREVLVANGRIEVHTTITNTKHEVKPSRESNHEVKPSRESNHGRTLLRVEALTRWGVAELMAGRRLLV